jgi:uncharacterized membrane protein YfcA
MDPAMALFGCGVGILVGLTGVGGGSLMTPLLILVFGVSPVTAVGTDLAYGAVTKTVGGATHLRQGTVDLRLSGWMALGSVPAALCGVYLLEALERARGASFDGLLLVFVAAAVLVTGTVVLARALLFSQLGSRERHTVALRRRDKLSAVAIGAFIGLVLGVTSVGSGALIAVALIIVFRLIPTRVVGTDIFHAAILLWAAAAAHVVAGNVDYALAGTILVGSVPGVWVGSRLAVRLPVGALRPALGIVLVAAGLALASKAGAEVPPAMMAGVPAALLIFFGVREALARIHRRVPSALPALRQGAPAPLELPNERATHT